ncbi:ComEA family DNA-binding protein [Rhodococcus sp. CX]|uniref:ComEA family DNA-binding protein n=1 Tax=Rhodococcus sp. CX TaxID=2789880 RepID=UPI0018CF507F|nr:ComEA family DNA-binding protein [Rhodococcus sp. CX]MBH0120259.1 ComEA family DNA-binding protein [Rhodococcus sp. CX]
MGSGDEGERVRSRLDAIARAAGDYGADGDYRAAGDDGEESPVGESEPLRLIDRLRAARWQTGNGGTAALGVVGIVAALVAFVVVWRDQPVPQAVPPLPSVSTASEPLVSAPSGAAAAPDMAEPEELVVSVVGLVAAPGLVTLAPGTRVADALTAAGGALPGADLTGINLAQRVADGDQIVVGAAPPDPPPPASSVSSVGTGAGSRASAPGGAASGGTASGGAAGPVNLNTADEAVLDALPGVGPVTAAAIIAWRDENGPFTDVEQLGEVDGIGPARLARLRTLVTV